MSCEYLTRNQTHSPAFSGRHSATRPTTVESAFQIQLQIELFEPGCDVIPSDQIAKRWAEFLVSTRTPRQEYQEQSVTLSFGQ